MTRPKNTPTTGRILSLREQRSLRSKQDLSELLASSESSYRKNNYSPYGKSRLGTDDRNKSSLEFKSGAERKPKPAVISKIQI